jgi:hypothetical protein
MGNGLLDFFGDGRSEHGYGDGLSGFGCLSILWNWLREGHWGGGRGGLRGVMLPALDRMGQLLKSGGFLRGGDRGGAGSLGCANLFGEGQQGVRHFLKLWHREESGGLGDREDELLGLGLGFGLEDWFRLNRRGEK